MIGKLKLRLYDPKLYAWKGYKFWTMNLEVLCKDTLGSHIDLASMRHWMQMDHVKCNQYVDC